MTEPTVHSVATALAALEERMNTRQAEYKTDIAILAKAMAEHEARQARERRNDLRWFIGIAVAASGIAVAAMRYLP